MKAPTLLSVVALLGAVAAGYLALVPPEAVTISQIDARVDARLAEREYKLVKAFTPQIQAAFVKPDDPEGKKDWSPKTLEELVAPMTRILEQMKPATE